MAGRGPSPAHVVQLIQGLPAESLTVALMRGSRKYAGWSIKAEALAAIYDNLSLQTEALGHWKDGKPPTLPRFPRPGDEEKQGEDKAKKKTRTVAELFGQFAR